MSSENIKILSIDGNSITSELDKAGYKKMGVTVKLVKNFADAQKELDSGIYDVIVINFDFEGIDGLVLCRHFKGQEATKDIPVVMTSVQARPREVKELSKAGMDLFVEQPVPRQYFIEKLRNLLDQKTRDTSRYESSGKVEFTYKDKEYSCKIGDLSTTGLLLLEKGKIPVDAVLELSFLVPHYKKPIKVTGTVVRDIKKEDGKKRLGYGVRFDDFMGDSEKRLERHLVKLNRVDPKLVYYL